MSQQEKDEIIFDIETTMLSLSLKSFPSQIDLDNYKQLKIILQQLDKLWN